MNDSQDERAAMERLRTQAAADPELPPFVRKILADGGALESIRLDPFGRWLHQGVEVEHPRVRTLFHRSLQRTAAGNWVLRVLPYTYPVRVDDVAHFVVRLQDSADGWVLHLASGEICALDPMTWCTDGEAWIGVRVHDGAHEARLVGSAHQTALEAVDFAHDGWRVHLPGCEPFRMQMRSGPTGASGRES